MRMVTDLTNIFFSFYIYLFKFIYSRFTLLTHTLKHELISHSFKTSFDKNFVSPDKEIYQY